MNGKTIKNTATYIVTAVLSLLIVFYIGYHLVSTFTSGIETTPAMLVTKKETVTAEAYILRTEELIRSDASGSVNYSVSDGEKVAAGEKIASVYSGGNVRERIKEIDEEIALLRASSLSETLTHTDTSGIDAQISSVYLTVLDKVTSGNISYAVHKRDELLSLLNKRQLILKSAEGYDDRIAALTEERNSLTDGIENVVADITAPGAGYFYSAPDGYEQIFSASKVDDMTIGDFDIMTSSIPNESFQNDGTVGKLVTDYIWYIALTLPKDTYRNFDADAAGIDMIFPYNSDIQLYMQLYRTVAPKDSDEVLLIFRCGNLPPDFSFLRRQTVELVRTSYEGYSVPSAAVRLIDGVQGVYVLDGASVIFREVKVIYETNGEFICEPYDSSDVTQSDRLRLYDFIITKGKDLYDGKVIT